MAPEAAILNGPASPKSPLGRAAMLAYMLMG